MSTIDFRTIFPIVKSLKNIQQEKNEINDVFQGSTNVIASKHDSIILPIKVFSAHTQIMKLHFIELERHNNNFDEKWYFN